MKLVLTIAAALVFGAVAANAQSTTQAAILGDSGNIDSPVRIQGGNGEIYHCKADIGTLNGLRVRRCIQVGEGTTLFAAGSGIGAGAAVAGGVLLVAVLAASDSGSGSATTTSSD